MDKNDFEKLGDLVKTLFIDLLDCVIKSKEENKWISSHYKFPVYIGKHKVTGMPEIRETFLSEDPKEYASLFKTFDPNQPLNSTKDDDFSLDEYFKPIQVVSLLFFRLDFLFYYLLLEVQALKLQDIFLIEFVYHYHKQQMSSFLHYSPL